MNKTYLCPQSATYTRLDLISPTLISSVILAEDDAFYTHSGFNWSELRNSAHRNLSLRSFVRGGSTITQQLAKNTFLNKAKTIPRKIREAILTVQIEELLSKNQIIERYLNVVEWGPNIFGISAAANYYFNKTPEQLNVLESTYLAHLLPSPKTYFSTFKEKKLSKYARYRILDLSYRLFRYRKISDGQYQAVKNHVDYFPWQNIPEDETPQLFNDRLAMENLTPNPDLPESDANVPLVLPSPTENLEIIEQMQDIGEPLEPFDP